MVRKCLSICMIAHCFARASDFSIDWWTVDLGGGDSQSGEYQVSGTIGQPDAGVVSSGEWMVSGGFWFADQKEEVVLTAERIVAGEVQFQVRSTTISAAMVQVSTDLQHWGDLGFLSFADGLAIFSEPVAGGAGTRFYRLRW